MKIFLYICILFTLLDIFFIKYAWTLKFFSKEWRSNFPSWEYKVNQDYAVGIVNIISTIIVCTLWSIYFYFYLFM